MPDRCRSQADADTSPEPVGLARRADTRRFRLAVRQPLLTLLRRHETDRLADPRFHLAPLTRRASRPPGPLRWSGRPFSVYEFAANASSSSRIAPVRRVTAGSPVVSTTRVARGRETIDQIALRRDSIGGVSLGVTTADETVALDARVAGHEPDLVAQRRRGRLRRA